MSLKLGTKLKKSTKLVCRMSRFLFKIRDKTEKIQKASLQETGHFYFFLKITDISENLGQMLTPKCPSFVSQMSQNLKWRTFIQISDCHFKCPIFSKTQNSRMSVFFFWKIEMFDILKNTKCSIQLECPCFFLRNCLKLGVYDPPADSSTKETQCWKTWWWHIMFSNTVFHLSN